MLSQKLKESEIKSGGDTKKFVEYLHNQAQTSRIDVESSIDGLLKSGSVSDGKLRSEIEEYREIFRNAIQIASNKISSEAIQELAIWHLVNNDCIVTGDGRSDWNNNVAKYFGGETYATTDRGNSATNDSRTTTKNYPGLIGLCKNQPTFKLAEGEKIVMTRGGMYIVNTLTGVIVRKISLPSTKFLLFDK